jgi:hypothetical protein
LQIAEQIDKLPVYENDQKYTDIVEMIRKIPVSHGGALVDTQYLVTIKHSNPNIQSQRPYPHVLQSLDGIRRPFYLVIPE